MKTIIILVGKDVHLYNVSNKTDVEQFCKAKHAIEFKVIEAVHPVEIHDHRVITS